MREEFHQDRGEFQQQRSPYPLHLLYPREESSPAIMKATEKQTLKAFSIALWQQVEPLPDGRSTPSRESPNPSKPESTNSINSLAKSPTLLSPTNTLTCNWLTLNFRIRANFRFLLETMPSAIACPYHSFSYRSRIFSRSLTSHCFPNHARRLRLVIGYH